MIFSGLDIGAVSTEAIVIDKDKNILGYSILRTGPNNKKTVEKSMQMALEKAKSSFDDILNLVATGYGRKTVPFKAYEISEISCHAKGAHCLFPDTKTVIDIGGQDSKAIHINGNGEAIDFNMNDKCAAGTGRFLEEMAKVLNTSVENLGKLAKRSEESLVISSMCTVFAESEVVSLLAENKTREDIANALHNAIADRILSLAYKSRLTSAVTITGGVAKNMGVTEAIMSKLPNMKVNISEEPQIVGALGAAVIARDMYCRNSEECK